MNVPDYMAKVRRVTRKRRDAQLDKFREFVMWVYARILTFSPVRTGYYRASHMITFSKPENVSVRKEDIDPSQGIPELYMRAADLLSNKVEEKQQEDGMRNLDVFIYNHLLYATALEHGHSKQAPQGVYRRARVIAGILWRKIAND